MKTYTIIYQLLVLLSITLMVVTVISGETMPFDVEMLFLLAVSAFIATYWKSYIGICKAEKTFGAKCYLAFSICLPVVHLLMGGAYFMYVIQLIFISCIGLFGKEGAYFFYGQIEELGSGYRNREHIGRYSTKELCQNDLSYIFPSSVPYLSMSDMQWTELFHFIFVTKS